MPKDKKTQEARKEERARNYPNLRPRPDRELRIVVTPERAEGYESAEQVLNKECSRRSRRLSSVVGASEESGEGPTEDRESSMGTSSISVDTKPETVTQEDVTKSEPMTTDESKIQGEHSQTTVPDVDTKSDNTEKSSPKSKSPVPTTEVIEPTPDYDEMHEVAAAVAAGNKANEPVEKDGDTVSQEKADNP